MLVPGLLLCSAVSAQAPKRQEQHFKVTAHPVITIHNPNGVITVKAWTKAEVMVISTPGSEKVDVDAEQMGNRVDISTHTIAERLSAEELSTDYQINVPEDAELQIHDDSGSRERRQRTGRHERGNHRSGRGACRTPPAT